MRDEKRILEVLESIEKLWNKFPNLRLGQLLMILAHLDKRENCFYIEDETLLEMIPKFEEEYGKV